MGLPIQSVLGFISGSPNLGKLPYFLKYIPWYHVVSEVLLWMQEVLQHPVAHPLQEIWSFGCPTWYKIRV